MIFKEPTTQQLETLERFEGEENLRVRYNKFSGKYWVMYSDKGKFGETRIQTTTINRNGKFRMNKT